MSAIAVLIDDLFEDSEYSEPVNEFKKHGHAVIHVGIIAGSTVRGKKEKSEVTIDRCIEKTVVDDFDALLIPGGHSPGSLCENKEAVKFVKDFAESGKPVFAICHGPLLLAKGGVLKGRRVTGWKSIKGDLIDAGAEYIDAAVVEDKNLVTSRHPGDLPGFIAAALKKLRSGR